MDNELRQFLEAMEERNAARLQAMETHLQAMETHLQAMETRLQAIDERLDRLDDAVRGVETRLNERIHDTETRLLTEFHKWASPMELRVRSHSAAIKAMDAEVEYPGIV